MEPLETTLLPRLPGTSPGVRGTPSVRYSRTMRVNQTRERLAKGETVFGCALQVYRSPEICRAFAAAGFDYVFIDMEHGSFDLETVQDMINAAMDNGITPIVRVAELFYSLVAGCSMPARRGLFCRAWKIPSCWSRRWAGCASRRWARAATASTHHGGIRGATVSRRSSSTRTATPSRWCSLRPSRPSSGPTSCSRVRGMNVAMVGPADLSISLGVPGQFENPLLVSTVERLIEKCVRHRVVPGIQVRTTALARVLGRARHALRGRRRGSRSVVGQSARDRGRPAAAPAASPA